MHILEIVHNCISFSGRPPRSSLGLLLWLFLTTTLPSSLPAYLWGAVPYKGDSDAVVIVLLGRRCLNTVSTLFHFDFAVFFLKDKQGIVCIKNGHAQDVFEWNL